MSDKPNLRIKTEVDGTVSIDTMSVIKIAVAIGIVAIVVIAVNKLINL
jgi:hypothetical protein